MCDRLAVVNMVLGFMSCTATIECHSVIYHYVYSIEVRCVDAFTAWHNFTVGACDCEHGLFHVQIHDQTLLFLVHLAPFDISAATIHGRWAASNHLEVQGFSCELGCGVQADKLGMDSL